MDELVPLGHLNSIPDAFAPPTPRCSRRPCNADGRQSHRLSPCPSSVKVVGFAIPHAWHCWGCLCKQLVLHQKAIPKLKNLHHYYHQKITVGSSPEG